MTGTVLLLGQGGTRVDESMLPGPQGRLVVALLVSEHRRAVSKDELAEALWGEDLPDSWERSLRVLVSKVRSALACLQTSRQTPLLESAFGTYRVLLPPGTVVDIDAARRFVHDAESALDADRFADAGAAALVAQTVTARPFLPGIDNLWADGVRNGLRALRVRALTAQAVAALALGDPHETVRCAESALKLDPYGERAVQLLMKARAAVGDRSRAFAEYADFARRLRDDLDAAPSTETQQLRASLLDPSQTA